MGKGRQLLLLEDYLEKVLCLHLIVTDDVDLSEKFVIRQKGRID